VIKVDLLYHDVFSLSVYVTCDDAPSIQLANEETWTRICFHSDIGMIFFGVALPDASTGLSEYLGMAVHPDDLGVIESGLHTASWALS
jgi:hypothetical protein